MEVLRGFTEQSGEVLAGSHTTDRPRENIIEHQRGDTELSEAAAKSLLDGAVHPASHKHAATLDIDRAHGIGKQHDAEDEPGRSLADVAFRLTARVIRGRGQVVEDNGGGAPEGNETQQRGGGHQNARNSITPAACGSRVVGDAAHVWMALACRLKCSHFSSGKSSEAPSC